MRAKITVADYAGNRTETEGIFAGWSDQVAFERRFGVNAAVLDQLQDAFDESGKLRADVDPTKIKTEWLAFLAWRVCRRSPAAATIDFDAWLENLAELELEVTEQPSADVIPAEGDPAVPTIATAAPQPSS